MLVVGDVVADGEEARGGSVGKARCDADICMAHGFSVIVSVADENDFVPQRTVSVYDILLAQYRIQFNDPIVGDFSFTAVAFASDNIEKTLAPARKIAGHDDAI